MPLRLAISSFGGLNQNDPEETLYAKAYQGSSDGFVQIAPLECTKMDNIDFTSGGIRERKGSTTLVDVSGIGTWVAGDALIAAIEWTDPTDSTNIIQVLVSKKSIYTDQAVAGAFVQINNAASAAYTHNTQTVTKVSFAEADGHLFIGMDGADNYIQVYRNGADLDDPLHNSDVNTYVDQDSASGAATLYVADTGEFITGERVVIAEGTTSEEEGVISSISAGASLTLEANLANTHSAMSWTERAAPKNFHLYDVVCGDELFVSVGAKDGTDAYIVTSPDGTTWTERANAKNMDLFGVTHAIDLYVAVGQADGSDAYILTSPDGVTWTERSNPQNKALKGITYEAGVFVAVGGDGGADAYIATSPDGTTWTERISPKGIPLRSVVYGDGLFVAVGESDGISGDQKDAYILTSPDGITWTERENPLNEDLNAVTYGNGLFVAGGAADATDAYLITSPDGITWTERSNPSALYLSGATFAENLYVMVGRSTGSAAYLIVSADGVNWDAQTNPVNDFLNGVAFGNTVFVAVGDPTGSDTYIITSPPGVIVAVGNQYTETYDTSTTHDITGTWDDEAFMIEAFQTRLLFSTGNTLVNYTPEAFTSASGIWDLAGSTAGFLQAAGNIRSLTAFAPKFADQITEALYVGTEAGFDVTTGFTTSDRLIRIEGAKSPLNHNCVAKALNWLVYLTDDKNIMGINGASVVNLGRRLKSFGGTGDLDALSVADSRASAYGFYNQDKAQAIFAFDSTTGNNNNKLAVIDFALGEPVPGENQGSFEKRVRCLYWVSSDTMYADMYQKTGAAIGIGTDNILYTLESGTEDRSGDTLSSDLDFPEFTAGSPERLKQWYRMSIRAEGQTTGTPTLNYDVTLDKSSNDGGSWSLLVASAKTVSKFVRINKRSESVKLTLQSIDTESWVVYSVVLTFDIGAELLG